ncbi:hypothetical protein ES705_10893 [subsurface metagenome]
MSEYFSVRDVKEIGHPGGIEILVWTDVPCCLYCRDTAQLPRVHRKPVLRRGTWLADDVRFCFTVFKDELHDNCFPSTFHRFTFYDWPDNHTRYYYFYAIVNGEMSVSTSAIFKYKNLVENQVEWGYMLHTVTTMEPEYFIPAAGSTWTKINVRRYVPASATGVLILVRSGGVIGAYGLNFRKPGTTEPPYTKYGFNLQSSVWCGQDEDGDIEVWCEQPAFFSLYVVGYTNSNVCFLNEPKEITGQQGDCWWTYNASEWPQAKALIVWSWQRSLGYMYGCRKYGSSVGLAQSSYGGHFILPLDDQHRGQIYAYWRYLDIKIKSWVVGYIRGGCAFPLNAVRLSHAAYPGWEFSQVDTFNPLPYHACLQIYTTRATEDLGVKKPYAPYLGLSRGGNRHDITIHAGDSYAIQKYLTSTYQQLWNLGVLL